MRFSIVVATIGIGVSIFSNATLGQTQEQSSYIFRYNPGLSSLMLESMTFKEEQQLTLTQCTVTARENGPLLCAVNCSAIPVCLLGFEGPPNLETGDILEKADESPTSGRPIPLEQIINSLNED